MRETHHARTLPKIWASLRTRILEWLAAPQFDEYLHQERAQAYQDALEAIKNGWTLAAQSHFERVDEIDEILTRNRHAKTGARA